MNDDSHPDFASPAPPVDMAASAPPSPSRPHQRPFFRNVFVGPQGIRAGWRFLLFVILFQGFTLAAQFALGRIPVIAAANRSVQNGGDITPLFGIVAEGTQTLLAFLAAFILSRIERRNRAFSQYGVPREGAFGRTFFAGLVLGLAVVSVEMLCMHLLGGFSYGTIALAPASILKYALIWAFIFFLVGLSEEFLYRGYTLFTLSTGIGFWPAAVFLSLLFGAAHLTNSGEDWIGALSVVEFALFACFTLRRTGNLWFAIGFHAAGDFAESFLYSVPDSGLMVTGHLLNSRIASGPHWLTGGSVGPEGSIFDFLFIAAAALLVALLYPANKLPAPNGPAATLE